MYIVNCTFFSLTYILCQLRQELYKSKKQLKGNGELFRLKKWRKTLWIWLIIYRLWLWLWWWLWLYNPAPQSVPKSHMVPLEPLAPPPPSVFLSTTQIYFGIFTNIVCDLYKKTFNDLHKKILCFVNWTNKFFHSHK